MMVSIPYLLRIEHDEYIFHYCEVCFDLRITQVREYSERLLQEAITHGETHMSV